MGVRRERQHHHLRTVRYGALSHARASHTHTHHPCVEGYTRPGCSPRRQTRCAHSALSPPACSQGVQTRWGLGADNQYLTALEERQTRKTKLWRTMLRQNHNQLMRGTSPRLRVEQRAQIFRQMQGQAEHKANGPSTRLLQILRDQAPVPPAVVESEAEVEGREQRGCSPLPAHAPPDVEGLYRIGKWPIKRHLRTIRPQSQRGQKVLLIGCQSVTQ